MKHFYFKSLFLSLLMIVMGGIGVSAAEPETLATFTASDYNSGTTGGWTVSNADYATATSGNYYKLISSDASIVTPSINWSNYSDITITISARKFGGPNATQGRISVSQGETELASYSPSSTSIVASSPLEISPTGGTITISCPGASSSKGCGVGSIVIKGTPKAVSKTLSSISLSGTYPTTFNVGDTFSHEGMTVTATYDDNTSEDVTAYATFGGYDMSVANTYDVTVSYTEREVTKTATYTITVNALTGEAYTLVTNANDLEEGDEVIIVNNASGARKAMGAQRNSNRGAEDITFDASGNAIVPAGSAIQVFTLEGGTSGWYFNTGSGYLYAASNSSNQLKTQTSKDDNAKAVITIDEGATSVVFQRKNGRNVLQYNSESILFSCYADATQTPILIYKKATELNNQYTLVTVDGETETEYPFEGNTLTKEFTGRTEFYIKDNNGKKYYGPQDTEAGVISAENHENLPTFDDEATYVLKKANTWVFTITELDASTTAGGITVTVNPQTVGETKYMISHSLTEESEDVFDEDLQLTKEMDTEAFYIIRSDDYGIFEMTAADHNVSDETSFYYIWEFSEDAPTVGYIPARRTNMYRVSKPGTYTFTLDTENKTVTAQFVSSKQYTLVKVEGFGETATETEYPFEGLTLTKEFTDPSRFYIKDSDGNNYYGLQNTEYEVDRYIIRTENHENLQTVESGEEFLLKKGNTWVFTITELDAATTAGGITLTVNPETVGETKYMISYSLTEESEDVFDENFKLTKEMDTTPFYITRSDDYGIFEVTAVERTNPDGYYRFTFTEDNNTVGFKVGERRNMYEMSEAGVYDFTLDLDAKTVTAVKTTEVTAAGNLNNSATGVFYGVDDMSGNGNDNKGKSATGKLTTAFGDVEVVYTVGTEYGNAYLKNDHIRMYAEGTTLKFTAPEGYVLTKIVLEKSSGNFNNLTTDVETYTNGTWEGEEESVTFTSQNATIQLLAAEVTLKKANFVKVNISAAEWATFVTPIAVAFPEDVNAYIIKEQYADRAVGEKITEAPAGTAVIINGTEGTHKLPDIGKSAEIESNKLLISDGTVTGDGTIYVLAVEGGQAGFAPLKSGKTLSEGKAYLKMENAGAKIAFVIDGEATDIRSIENTVDFSNGDWYNLQGVKVTSPQKGIYIHNGKKVVVK